MLGFDYSARLRQLIGQIEWQIRLPEAWDTFFDERGVAASSQSDRRRHQRMNVRTPGVMWFCETIRQIPRPAEPVGVYTRDLSRRGVGLVAPLQLFPEERLRVALQTFWVELRVVSCRRVTDACYIVGNELVAQHPPGPEAFTLPTVTAAEAASPGWDAEGHPQDPANALRTPSLAAESTA